MMETTDALEIIARYRKNQVVLTTMTANRGWENISDHELDLPVRSCMGKASSLGLGIALARPDVPVWVIDGDGCLLNNLGTLVTVGNLSPANFYHFVLHNGVYRVSGGQPIPGEGKFSFCGLAKAAGYSATGEFNKIEDIKRRLPRMLREPGPALISLNVAPSRERLKGRAGDSSAQALARIKAVLQRDNAR